MLLGLNHLTLAVSEVERSFRFYVEVLGFTPKARWHQGAYLTLGELWLCLSLDDARRDRTSSDYTHYAFSVAPVSFALIVERLRKSGVQEWKSNHSEGESCYFLDPDRHALEIHCGDLASRLAACREKPYQGMVFY
ncbi:TPA: fosfomycin resistance glutathione transferase [Serratia fonticola]|uniref:Glutathione transferase fosA n=1 Tax=Serratia fonticola TaxID=47917 RepID=A0A0F7HH22_SERFO|nr:fosfomycin resistance glutathione transferase [Serratia fonticola]AKG71844.1 glutathione transferase [Serratia fonticola]CAI1523584.1 Glutathione transferase fosA [Serratia fonticola]CAI1590181.1 Glutathione transferase fosA [Serratia fonticola]CAI1600308.1 Glutathione transferase fosA [Serratia fonticola]CAI1703670.1 Glutathione transferase fosA [Serratia fonticola]